MSDAENCVGWAEAITLSIADNSSIDTMGPKAHSIALVSAADPNNSQNLQERTLHLHLQPSQTFRSELPSSHTAGSK